jgi:hypothetical protein
MTDAQIVIRVLAGKRPSIPPKVPKEFTNVIKKCLKNDPKLRPSFQQIHRLLDQIIVPKPNYETPIHVKDARAALYASGTGSRLEDIENVDSPNRAKALATSVPTRFLHSQLKNSMNSSNENTLGSLSSSGTDLSSSTPDSFLKKNLSMNINTAGTTGSTQNFNEGSKVQQSAPIPVASRKTSKVTAPKVAEQEMEMLANISGSSLGTSIDTTGLGSLEISKQGGFFDEIAEEVKYQQNFEIEKKPEPNIIDNVLNFFVDNSNISGPVKTDPKSQSPHPSSPNKNTAITANVDKKDQQQITIKSEVSEKKIDIPQTHVAIQKPNLSVNEQSQLYVTESGQSQKQLNLSTPVSEPNHSQIQPDVPILQLLPLSQPKDVPPNIPTSNTSSSQQNTITTEPIIGPPTILHANDTSNLIKDSTTAVTGDTKQETEQLSNETVDSSSTLNQS